MEICGNCKHWNTLGFNRREISNVGECNLVARHWYPPSPDKMISLKGTEHSRWPQLISVITRREFGCNQFTQNE